MFNPKIEKFTWGMVKYFSRIFPDMIGRSFYPRFSKKPIHKLKKDDIQELVSAMKHYNSKTGFLNDIDQNINDEVITIKKILKADYPRGRAKGYYASFISAKKPKIEFSLFHPTVSQKSDISPNF